MRVNKLKYLFLICFVVHVVSAEAQYYRFDRGLTEAHIGVALPFFDFGKGKGTRLAQHAQTGFNLGGSVAYFYSRHMALEFDLNYNINSVNSSKLADVYAQTDTALISSASVSTGSFHDISGMVGLRFDLPVNEYFSIVLKMMGGLRAVHKPEASINLSTISGPMKITETSDTQILFALYSSFGTRLKITDNLDVHMDASYIGSRIDFEFERNSIPITEPLHMGVIIISAGIGYSF